MQAAFTLSGSPLQTTLMQIRFKELLKLIKRNLASGVVIQIRVVRTRHDVQLFVLAAQRFEWIGELTVEDWEGKNYLKN